MYLTHLALTNFRIFSRLDQEIPSKLVLLVGDNAQGKTSMLEAVFYLATLTSFHAHNDRQLINFDEAQKPLGVARLVADYVRGDKKHRLEVRLIQEANGPGTPFHFRKEIIHDGVKRSANEVIGEFNAVIFTPQMTRIIEQGPEERRRFLNLALSQAIPGYAQALTEYNQGLVQRNALLKQFCEHPNGDMEQMIFWDSLVAKKGSQIMLARIQALKEMERIATRVHIQLTHSAEILRFVYQPSYEPLPAEPTQFSLPISTPIDRSKLTLGQIQEGFEKRLKELYREEIARGTTTIGPHRDEIRFLANGIDLGDFGSRGQIRTTLLAIKLAEVAWMQEKTGQTPILLLDEILSELDNQRREDMINALGDIEQGLLTTTDLHLFPGDFSHKVTLWQVSRGEVKLLPKA